MASRQTSERGAPGWFRVAFRVWGILAGVAALAHGIPWAAAGEIPTPLVVWDVNFDDQEPDVPPCGLTKEQSEQFQTKGSLSWVPLRTYNGLAYVTRTRKATVVKAALGLADKPVLFSAADDDSKSYYSPQISLNIPQELAEKAQKWRLSLDVSKAAVTDSSFWAIFVWDVVNIKFHWDGVVYANTGNDVAIADYSAGKPMHFDFLIDVPAKIVTITIDGDPAKSVTLPWMSKNASVFNTLKLGLLTGGNQNSIAFDNIKLILEESK
jgi:hypothetical protein